MNPTPTTTAARGTKRAFNFNAGPGALPLSVLERMQDEMLDYAGTGMSVMELSHRSPEFEAITENAEQTSGAFWRFRTSTPSRFCKAAEACNLPWCR